MSGTVTVIVVSPDTRSERRFDLHLTVQQLKTKLESITGIPVSAQRIVVQNSEDDDAGAGILDDDTRLLGFYGIRDWQVLKVEDTSPPGASLTGQFTDVSLVEKFEITEEEYAKRQDSVLAYKQRYKLGRFAPNEQSNSTSALSSTPEVNLVLRVNERCEVEPATDGEIVRRGVIRFVGPTEFGSQRGTSVWVGVEYDEPVGKNDGSVNGKQYFTCRSPYGGFVRPERVRVGDYPPVDLEDELEEM